ncbi:TonB-dependent receptor [Paucibacter sp. JuS9]|uniref:TonB-dependent receptor n=1 Tax=Roseateles TaxID=93681 RepID=UPI002FE6667A
MKKTAMQPPRAAGNQVLVLRSTVAAAMTLGLAIAASAQEAKPAEPQQLEGVTITGARKSAESAQLIKMKSDQVVDSIVADDIGKFPDKNVAEILGRVTGVQIQRGNGEAGSVIVRGLGGIVTLLNGREFFSDSGRSLYLADVPATMLQRLDVYKTQGADLPEGGTAGVIDVRTNRPFDFKDSQVVINGRMEHRDKAKADNPDLSGMASNRWKTEQGEFGALVGLSYQKGTYHDERAWVGDPVTFNHGGKSILGADAMGRVLDLGDRKRLAGNLALQWKPNADMEFFLEGFATKIDHRFQQSFLVAGIPVFEPTSVVTTKPGTNNLDTVTNTNYPGWGFTSTQAKHDEASNKQFALGGHWDATDRLRVSSELAHTKSRIDWVNRILDTGYAPTNTIGKVQDGGGYIDYPTLDLTKATNFRVNGGVDVRGERSGDSTDWRADAVYDMAGNSFFKEFSTGVRLAKRHAMAVNTSMPWTTSFSAVGQLVSNFPGIYSVSPATWGDFGVKQYVYADREWLLDNGEAFRKMLTGSTALTAYDPMTLFDDEEKTSAVYGKTKFGFNAGGVPVSGVAGLRLVRTQQHLMGNSRNAATNVITPVDVDTSRTDALPSLALKAEFSPKLIGRLVLGKAIERPNFVDYNPGVTYTPPGGGVTFGTASGGNPNLKPTESKNIDVALEYYFARTGSLTATVFEHKFKNRVVIDAGETTINGVRYNTSQPINLNKANLGGYELSYRQFYDWLPGVFSGLGLEANFTYMSGKQINKSGLESDFLGQSKRAINLVALYEKNDVYGRLAYNWRSKFLAEYPYRTTGRELWVAPLSTLDASAGYTFNKHLTISLDVTNLLNQAYHDYFDKNPAMVRDVRYYDRTYGISLRWKM